MRLLCFLSALFILSSCSRDADFIQLAEEVIEQHPDSALLLLDSVSRPNILSESDLNKYILLQIKAKDRLYMDITQDTAIFYTATFYVDKEDNIRATQANYYCGRLLHEKGEIKDAINYYIEADKSANLLPKEYNQKGVIQMNIGYLLFKESEYSESLDHFRSALSYFDKINNITNIISANIEIGNCYAMLNIGDSARFYYDRSLSLAETSNLTDIKLWALQNLALVYQVQGDNDDAIDLYNQILELTSENATQTQIYLSLSRIYYEREKMDSVNFYLDKSIEINELIQDPYFTANLYNLSSNVNEELGEYEKALSDYKIYATNLEVISSEAEKKTVLDIERKYKFERIRNINNELYIKNTRYFIVCLVILLILIIVFIIYQYTLVKKKKLLNEAENKILQLNNLALSYNKNRDSFRDILLHHFDILKKSTMIRAYLRSDEIEQGEKLLNKFNNIVYNQDELDWDMLYQTMNRLHGDFFDKLKKLVPNLDESEFKICCLIYADFTNKEIGIIMKLSTSSIAHKRSSIRKKLGLEEYGNIYENLKFLSEK